MKKSILWIMMIILSLSMVATFALTGCKEPEVVVETVTETVTETVVETVEVEKEGRVTIEFWSGETDPPSIAAYNEMMKAFQEENPNVLVSLQFLPIDEFNTKISTTIAAGGTFDVFVGGSYDIFGQLALQGQLLSLDSIVENMGGTEEFLYPSALSRNAEGNIVAIPYALGGPVFWYRKDLFEEKGIPLPPTDYTVGWSWEEALDAISKVHSDEIAGISLPAMKDSYTDYMVFINMITNAAEMFDNELNVTLDTPENLAAFEYYLDLLEYAPADATEISWFESIDAFAAGRAATHMYWGRDLGHIYAEAPDLIGKVAAAPLPNNAGKSWTYVDFDNAYAIYGGTEHPEECKAWVDFILRPENAVKFLATVPGHLLPVTHEQSAALAQVEIPEISENPEIAEVLFSVPEYAHSIDFAAGALWNWRDTGEYANGVRNPYAFTATATNILGVAVQRVFINDEDPATVWSEAHAELEAAVEESKAAVE